MPNPISRTRQVIHLDLDAFYASVERLLNPSLDGKPVLVAMGDPKGRGVVATASYEARKFGIHSAMPLREALRLCPKSVVVPVRHELYAEYSHRVMELVRAHSPIVEQVSIDEAYAEVAQDRDAEQVAHSIQDRIKTEIGLDCTIAVATSRLVSKIACNTVKPRGFVVIPPGQEQQFLASLPLDKLPGAGKVTRGKLARWKVRTIGDLLNVPLGELEAEFGKLAHYLHDSARGIDDSPVINESRTRSLSQETTFDRDTRDLRQLEANIHEMSSALAELLAKEGYCARTVVIKVRFDDFTTMTRQTTFRVPTADGKQIRVTGLQLLRENWDTLRPVRLIGVGVHNLLDSRGEWQMGLPIDFS